MDTFRYEDKFVLKRNSLVEICILPSVKVHEIMHNISRQFDKSFYIDTIGNLKYILEDIVMITSMRKLMREINSLSKHNNFALFIDSISFLSDKKINFYHEVYGKLWSLIYYNNATIIVSNHYGYVKYNNSFLPRLGSRWSQIISYRIYFKYKKGKLVYELIDNSEY